MNYALVVKVPHTLGYLLGNYDDLVHVELVPPQVQVGVQGVPLAQRGDDSQARWLHAGPHEQHKILMPCFPDKK